MFDKITFRITKLSFGLNPDHVDPVRGVWRQICADSWQIEITKRVIQGVFPGVTTVELDSLAAETAASLTTRHPDYAILAARIAVSNLHKQTKKIFSGALPALSRAGLTPAADVMHDLYTYVNPRTGKPAPLLSEETWKAIETNKDRLNSSIIYDRDFNFQYFGFKARRCDRSRAAHVLADAGALVPAEAERRGARAPAAHVHARGDWYPRQQH